MRIWFFFILLVIFFSTIFTVVKFHCLSLSWLYLLHEILLFFVSGVNGIFSLISFSVCLSFVYRKTIYFYVLIFHYLLLFSPSRPTESTFYFTIRTYYTLILHTHTYVLNIHTLNLETAMRDSCNLYIFKSSFFCLTPSAVPFIILRKDTISSLQLNKTPLCI